MRSIGFAVLLLFFGGAEARAQVVALGASDVDGYGLSRSEAWPAQLEQLLLAKGFNVTVSNQGVSGDTTYGMLGRVDSAAPDGTRLVIFSPGSNDSKSTNSRFGTIDHEGNIKAIIARLRARGITVLGLGGSPDSDVERAAGATPLGPTYRGVPSEDLVHMGRGHDNHPDAKGEAIIAARLLPSVMRALGRKG